MTPSRYISLGSHRERLLVLLGLTALAFGHPILDKVWDNGQFFVAKYLSRVEIFALLGVLFLGIPLAGWFMCRIGASLHRRLGALLYLCAVAILLACFFSAFLLSATPLPGWAILVGAGVLTSLALVVYTTRPTTVQFLCWVSVASIISPLYFVFSSSVTPILFPSTETSAHAQRGIKALPRNVVVVVLDEFPLSGLLDESLRIDPVRYPNFAALASTSYWFRNATAVSTHTSLAVPAILSGRYPSAERALATYSVHPNNLFTLLGDFYEVHADERVSSLCPREICRGDVPDLEGWQKAESLAWDLAAIYLHVIVPPDLGFELPDIAGNWGNFWDNQRASRKKRADWRRGGRVKDFRDFIDTLGKSERPTFRFSHQLLPHMPYQYLPSGKRYAALDNPRGYIGFEWQDDTWARTQAYQQFLAQVETVDGLIGDLLTRLKTTGVFDDTLLVVTADHGASFQVGQHRRGHADHPSFYEDLLSIPLFVKLPGQREGVLSERSVESVDILPTIADLLGLQLASQVDGTPMINDAIPPRAEKRMVVGKKRHQGKLEEVDRSYQLVAFPVPTIFPRQTLDWKLEIFGTGTTRPKGLWEIGPLSHLLWNPLPENVESPLTVKLSPKLSSEWKRGKVAITADQQSLPAHIVGEISGPDVRRNAPILISVNGHVTATTFVHRIHGSDRLGFSALLPEESFRVGENRLEISMAHESRFYRARIE